MKLKNKIFEIIQPGDSEHIASKIFDCFIMALILFGIMSVFFTTFDLSIKTNFYTTVKPS